MKMELRHNPLATALSCALLVSATPALAKGTHHRRLDTSLNLFLAGMSGCPMLVGFGFHS